MADTLKKCKHVFQSLNMVAAQEMADVATSLFAPVRMGVVYPSSPFILGSAPDATSTSDDIFSAAPLPQRFVSSSNSPSSSTRAVRFADQQSVEQPPSAGAGSEMMDTDNVWNGLKL